MKNARIAIPSEGDGGIDGKRSEHFGHCDVFTIIDVKDGVVIDSTTIDNGSHEHGGCMVPVKLLAENNIPTGIIKKVSLGRPHVVDAIKNGDVQLVINTGTGDTPRQDGYMIRRAAIKFGIPYTTTLAGARAMCRGLAALKEQKHTVKALQEYHQ